MRRVVPLLAVALVLVACDEDVPTEIAPPSPLIQDGNQNNGNPAFFWLAPIVQNNLFGGVFNPQLKPRVSICRLDLTLDPVECDASAPLLATWTLDTGLVLEGEKYHVNWHTDETDTDFTATYRIQVFLHEHPSAQRLGVADVQFFSNGQELKNINTEEEIPLHDGRTLPIQFRIEKGASCEGETDCGEATIGAGGGTVTTESGFAGVEIPAGAVDGDILVKIRRVDPATQPWGRCLPTGLRQEEGCYEFDTEPSIGEVNAQDTFNQDVVVAVCVDPAAIREEKLLLHKYDPENPDTGVVALEGAAEDFLTCDEFAFQDGAGLFARFAGVAKRLISPVARLVGASPLYAKDAGRGGVTDAFSFVGWAEPLELSLLSAPVAVLPQAAVPATILGVTEHNHGDPALPASDHVLRYDYTDPAGTVAVLGPDTTDAAGHSAPSWTLTDQIGVHVVEVSTRMEILVEGQPFLVPDETVPLLVQVGGYESAEDCAGADDCGQAIVGPTGDTLVTENADAGVAIPAGALASPVLVTIRAVDPSAQPWGRCLPTGLRQEGLCYEFDTEPSLAVANDSDQDKFLLDVVVAVCLEEDAIREDYLLLHKYDPEHPDSGVVALDGAPENFLSCPGDIVIGAAGGGLIGRVARAVTRLVTPRPLYAKDAGRGGVTDAFSYIGWAEPVDLSLVGSLPVAVLPSTAVGATIQATTEHNHTNDPLDASGHTLRFDYTDAASVEDTLPGVLTGGTGQAAPAWTLTSAVGVHALDVSTRMEIEVDNAPFLVPDPTPILTLTVGAYTSANACAETAADCGQAVVGPSGDTLTTENGFAGVAIPPGALDGPVLVTIQRVDPDGQPWGNCLPTGLRQEEGCYQYDTEPALSAVNAQDAFNDSVVVAVCIDPGAVREDYLALHKYDPENPLNGVVELPGADENFLTCDAFAAVPNGFLGRLAQAGRRMLAPVLGAVAPKPLYAKDAGRGGVTDAFSFIGWAEPVTLSLATDPDGTTPGITDVVVTALTAHNHVGFPATPADGHTIRFEHIDPSNDTTVTEVVTSIVGGAAQARISLNALGGTHSVKVSTQQEILIDEDLLVFEGGGAGFGAFGAPRVSITGLEVPFLVPDPTGVIVSDVEIEAEAFGSVSGLVLDAFTGAALPGATVQVQGTTLGAVTNVNGQYFLSSVPAGSQTLIGSMVGYQPASVPVTVTAGGGVGQDILLTPASSGGLDVDGVMSEGEWSDAVSFAPVDVNLPGEGTTQASIWVTNDAENLYIAVRYEVDLSEVSTFTSLNARFDENVNNEVECGEDGLTVWTDGEFFDQYFDCAADPPQHQPDTGNDGSEDGVTATGFHDGFTVVELSHPLNSGDPLDFSLTAEDLVGLILFTNIGLGEALVRTDLLGDFPTSVPYTVQ